MEPTEHERIPECHTQAIDLYSFVHTNGIFTCYFVRNESWKLENWRIKMITLLIYPYTFPPKLTAKCRKRNLNLKGSLAKFQELQKWNCIVVHRFLLWMTIISIQVTKPISSKKLKFFVLYYLATSSSFSGSQFPQFGNLKISSSTSWSILQVINPLIITFFLRRTLPNLMICFFPSEWVSSSQEGL